MTKINKKIISIFLVLMIFISQISMVFATQTEESIKEYVIINNENDISNVEKLTNTQKLYLWAEDYDISKINFSNLQNLEEICIYSGQLNGKVSFKENLNLKKINISLDCDLSDAVIDLRGIQKLWYVQIDLDTTKTEEFSIINTILTENDHYAFTDISGNQVQYLWSPGMGGGNPISCDTMETYLANFYPGISKESITELDMTKWGTTFIGNITGLNELTSLKKATLSYIDDFSEIDFEKLSNLEELKLIECFNDTIIGNKLPKLKHLTIDCESGIDLSGEFVEFLAVDIRRNGEFAKV